MKCLRLIFAMIIFVFFTSCKSFGVDGKSTEGLIYIEPEVARIVIERTFANMVSEYSEKYTSESDDITILKNVIDAYNDMLRETGGYVSASGLNHVCDVAFRDLKPKVLETYIAPTYIDRKVKCLEFAESLVNTKLGESDCAYSIKKVNGSQMHIKYTSKSGGKGFSRKGGTLAWRFFNPGALRDSPYKCVIMDTKPNGKFAVFDSHEKGRFAIRWLLENGSKYQGLCPRQAIPMYAPNFENNTAKYIVDLGRQGVDVDKKMSELSGEEWELLLDAISQIEGWNTQGVMEEF